MLLDDFPGHILIIGGSEGKRINYMLNARAACTTFKSSLTCINTKEEVIPISFKDTLFTVVRNPFSRILSQYECYKDELLEDVYLKGVIKFFAKQEEVSESLIKN